MYKYCFMGFCVPSAAFVQTTCLQRRSVPSTYHDECTYMRAVTISASHNMVCVYIQRLYTLGGSGGEITAPLSSTSSPTPARLSVSSVPPSSPGRRGSSLPDPLRLCLPLPVSAPSELMVSCVPLRSRSRSASRASLRDLDGLSTACEPSVPDRPLRVNTDPARSRIREIPNGVEVDCLRSLFIGASVGRNRLDR